VPLQVKLVVVISAALTLGGALWWLVVEWHTSLAGLPFGHKLTNSLFHSVTLRTAGFNSLDLMQATRPTIVVMMVLMFIGASPGGTGGGVKTTTFGVLLGAVLSAVRGGTPIVLFGREVPWGLVYRSAAVLMVSAATATAGFLFLLSAEEAVPFERLAFEVASAMGTVGLTLGVTPLLGTASKLAVVALMFAGRVGPLTLVLLFGRAHAGRIGHPEAKVMIG
jgi:trk system potassium uptake protein TrkH